MRGNSCPDAMLEISREEGGGKSKFTLFTFTKFESRFLQSYCLTFKTIYRYAFFAYDQNAPFIFFKKFFFHIFQFFVFLQTQKESTFKLCNRQKCKFGLFPSLGISNITSGRLFPGMWSNENKKKRFTHKRKLENPRKVK